MTPDPAITGGLQLRPPERLGDRHDLAAFDCGKPDLNDWLVHRARVGEGRSARTYVLASASRVIGYYCLAAGSVSRAELPKASLRRNLPLQVPVIVIGRLAVDTRFWARGFDRALLRDALMRCLGAAEAIGVRAVLVHAIDEDARAFYRKFGFLPFPDNPSTLVLPLETVMAGRARG